MLLFLYLSRLLNQAVFCHQQPVKSYILWLVPFASQPKAHCQKPRRSEEGHQM